MLLYPYKKGSKSAKDLSQALGIKRIKTERSRFKGRASKVVVNWGCSQLPDEVLKCQIINSPDSVARASNKLTAFQVMSDAGVRVPDFKTSDGQDELQEELMGMSPESVHWLARTKLSGHSGDGIVLLKGCEAVPHAPLYTKYIKKKFEYRVHVMRGEVVDVQRKARSSEVPDDEVNWHVRSHGNGFIFARNEGHTPHNDVLDQAVEAVRCLGLDFGAVDVIFNERSECAYVLEVNTAPGLAGETLRGYVDRLRESWSFG